ncbi:MAG: condensation domain-containing protein, partial [Bacillota bacterium]|nr:condensation domain-containing protein [Bacillota bacterium]
MYAYETLIDLIVSRKAIENQGITFIYGDCDECFVSYKELYFKALSLLNILQEAGFKEKDEVVLQIDNNKSFVITFWACVLGGMIPVPITAGANDEHKMKLFRIWNVLNNPRMVSTADFLARFSNFAAKNGLTEQMSLINERTFCMDDINYKAQYGKISIVSPEDIAFIQFSSGSTGEPKGVIITHKNVLINLSSVIKWINIGPDDSSLNWMPLTHDMGLIGTHIKSILACINQYNIETSMFIRHPTLWIEKASEHKVTLLYSPNFGYKHFLKFLKDHRERSWDLSAVRFIFNGAEPISVDLCNEFLDKMSSYGLKRTAMYTVYGLAEGTIAVTFPKLNEELSCLTLKRDCLGIGDIVKDTKTGSSKGCTFADLGYPIHNCYMRICDENDKDLGENKIGYVHIRGGNVTRGYYNNKEATQKAINNAGWLNTGDLGFLRNGRLVITGRAKDVIFISGQNYYSHDIERTLEEIDGVELGKSAAIGVFNEGIKGDELILFILSRLKVESFIQIINKVKELISRKIGIEVSKVIPIKNIPKTTSGKVQRFKLRESYLNGDYDSVLEEIKNLMDMEFDNREIDLPQNAVEKRLLNIWTEVLNVKKIGMGDDFFQLGGDSLRATQLISRIRETFGVELEQAEFFGDPKISKLAKYIERAPKRTSQPTALLRSTCNKEYLPLSFSQERLWFLNSLNGESAQYNLYSALRLRGSLNHEALKKSLNEVVNRHDTLKMSFTEIDGQPLQIINHGLYIDLPIIDLSETHEKEREKNVSEMLCKEAGKPFALEKAPLIRGKLYRMDKNDHILLLTAHHIIFDGWSFAILLKELVACYEAYLNNREHSLPPVEFQYADFASWQKHKQNNKYFDTQLQYWREKLSGTLPTLNLHIDKVRPAVQTYKGARFTGMISSGTVLKLKDIAQREGVTLYMVLLAAFKVLLYKYTGQEDIIVGSPVANRNRLEYEPIIGFFTNNLVLRTVFSSDDSFSMLLKNVREVTLKAYENQDIPFERLVDELHVARDMSRNPIFQILFGLHNVPTTNAEFTGINMSTINIDSGFSRFDLSVDIYNFGEDLQVDFEYNTDLFYPDTISQMAEHYFQALSKVVENPLERISKIDILTSNELRLLLKEWNNTKADFCNNLCWIDIFEEQVGKNPDAIAVISGEKEISYDELNKRANQLANFLISIGVKKETIVGIYT